jgi:hypothetical protein
VGSVRGETSVVPRWTYTRTKLETADRAKENLKPTAFPLLGEVQLTEAAPDAARDSRVEIRLQNGRSLVVGRGFDAEHVRALLAVVETAS